MGLRKNFLYSSILTTSSYFFPLLTFPYVSRVLGVTNIGICNFVDSIINYFVLFAMMGIRTIGIREIAKHQGDKEHMSETFSNLIVLNFFFVFISGFVLFVLIQIVPQFVEHKTLMYVGLVKLFATFMLIEWLFKGVEDFKYITKRSIIIRSLYVVSVFVFVRDADDYPIFFTLLMLMEGVNAVVNCIYSRKYIVLKLRNLHPFKYLKSSLTVGCYTLLTTMYTTFNVAYLGFVADTTEVGYYTTATKLHHIILAIFTAFTGVMLPRMSNLIANDDYQEFTKKNNQTFSVLFHFSFPAIVIGISFANVIIRVISGAGYERATIPLIIVMPLILIIGIEQVLVYQILMPLKKDKEILINSFIGAFAGVLVNILLVQKMGSIGSAIVWSISELCVMLSAIYFVNKNFQMSWIKKKLLYNLLLMIPAFMACYVLRHFILNQYLAFVVSIVLITVYYGYIYIKVFKDALIISILPNTIKKYVQR